MYTYLFTLGNHPKLSLAELTAYFARKDMTVDIDMLTHAQARVRSDNPLTPQRILPEIGGTKYISEYIGQSKQSISFISHYLNEIITDGKIQFSLHGNDTKSIGLAVKKELKAMGRSARYIAAKNTATIIHNKLTERQSDLTLLNRDIFVTRAVQAIEARSSRDYDRPGRDSKSGMLPPKLAQMMINLAGLSPNETLLDPFCGSGTVLMEASLMGYQQLIGTDISAKAIHDTRTNLDWIAQEQKKKQSDHIRLEKCETKKLAHILTNGSIGAIVTEPFMGRPLNGREHHRVLVQQAEELKQLYVESFETFYDVLQPGGRVIFIFPSFRSNKEWISTNCTAAIEALGFVQKTFLDEYSFLRYARSKQHLARDIYCFEKQ